MTAKKELGQFMTTNYEYILKNMSIPSETKTIIEPFCGQGDLLKFISSDKLLDSCTSETDISINHHIDIECYDIDPQHKLALERDTLTNPPQYDDKFVLTNPPYLARNKSDNKLIFDQYDQNDLYKCFLCSMIRNPPLGGIIIIPLNFLSSVRKADIGLRQYFLQKFDLLQVNIFEEQVFDDTTYTVCAIQFEKKNAKQSNIKIDIYPSKIHIETKLTASNNYMIGGHIYNLPKSSTYEISRLTRTTINDPHTNILVKCIDDNKNNQIRLSIVPDDQIYVDQTANLSARTYATLQIVPHISPLKQAILVKRFNQYLTSERIKFNSLFLCNYRESKDIARKRISFGLVYLICQYLLDQIDKEENEE